LILNGLHGTTRQKIQLFITTAVRTSNPTLWPWRWRRHIPPKRRLILNGIHGVISQNTELFVTTAVRTSDFYRS
jgi:hypothetical protein